MGKPKEFSKLQAEWYRKLKKSGFDDVEQTDGNLKIWSAHYFQSAYTPDSFTAKETYYRLAGQFLHSHKFKTPHEREVWRLHSEGESIRAIAAHLGSYPNKIHKIIKKLSKEMLG